jgi:hypothetical protein
MSSAGETEPLPWELLQGLLEEVIEPRVLAVELARAGNVLAAWQPPDSHVAFLCYPTGASGTSHLISALHNTPLLPILPVLHLRSLLTCIVRHS